jgi:hypothetical protein
MAVLVALRYARTVSPLDSIKEPRHPEAVYPAGICASVRSAMRLENPRHLMFPGRIQADFPKRSPTSKAVALKLCLATNNILATYNGVTGEAQIIPTPRNIKVSETSIPSVVDGRTDPLS